MKYLPIDRELFINNRKRFCKHMNEKTLAVFNSNDIFATGADSTLPFVQHRDIFHLSGVDQEESILVLFPDCHEPKHREILFLKETNEHIAVWEGPKLSVNDTKKLSGISNVLWIKNFDKIFSFPYLFHLHSFL